MSKHNCTGSLEIAGLTGRNAVGGDAITEVHGLLSLTPETATPPYTQDAGIVADRHLLNSDEVAVMVANHRDLLAALMNDLDNMDVILKGVIP